MNGVYLMREVFLKFLFGTCQSLLFNMHLDNPPDLPMQLFINAHLLQNRHLLLFIKVRDEAVK